MNINNSSLYNNNISYINSPISNINQKYIQNSNNFSNNNNNNNNNSNQNKLFFQIWRNCYLRSKILKFLKLINIHFQRRIYSIETHLSYQYKDYLRYVLLDFKDKEQLVQLLKTLPKNIKSVSLNYFRFKEKLDPGTIPDSITEFKFNGLYDAPLNSKLFSSSIKSLVLPSRFNQPLLPLPNDFDESSSSSYNNNNNNNNNNYSISDNPIKNNIVDDFERLKSKLKYSSTDDEKMSNYEEDEDGATISNNSNSNNSNSNNSNNSNNNNIYINNSFSNTTFTGSLSTIPTSNSNSITSTQSTSNFVYLNNQQHNLFNSYNGIQTQYYSSKEGFQLPPSLTFLSLGLDFNYQIDVGVLPKSLLKLKFGSIFNYPIKQGVLPESITELSLGDSFNQPLPKGILGNSLKKLELGFYWDQPLKTNYDTDCQDSTLTYFPDSIETLRFGRSFNKQIGIGSLPKSLTVLDFCWIGSFNKPLEPGSLPYGLKILKLSRNWLQTLHSNTLPPTITILQFNTDTFRSNENVNNILDLNITRSIPSSVTKLSLGNLKEPIVPFSLPNSITSLNIGSEQKIFNYSIPESVTVLSGVNKKYFDLIPSTVTRLKYSNYKDSIISTNCNSIPSFIKSLILGLEYNTPFNSQELSKLSNLQEIYLGIDFNHPFEPNMLPPNLKTLCLSLCFNHKIEKGVLPESLTSLRIGSDYRHEFDKDVLPRGLLLLELGSNYSFDLPLSFIPSIQTIIVRGRPNIVLEKSNINMDSTSTSLDDYSNNELDYTLPESLRSIIIFSNNTLFINQIYLNIYLFDYIKIICSSKIISKNGKLFKKINDTLINNLNNN